MAVELTQVDDYKFVLSFLGELKKQLEVDMSAFNAQVEQESNMAVTDDGDEVEKPHFAKKTKVLFVIWRPGKTHPLNHVDHISVRWKPALGFMYLEVSTNTGNRNTSIGTMKGTNGSTWFDIGKNFKTECNDIKLLFLHLYKTIKAYKEVEIPRLDKERLVNSMCEAFPHILDDILLGETLSEPT